MEDTDVLTSRPVKEYQSIVALIDSGDEKFKLGLAWYIIYELIDQSDYHYIDLMKQSTDEIKRILDERYNSLLICGCVKDTYTIQSRAYNRMMSVLKKRRTDPIFNLYNTNYTSISSTIGDYMYHLLTNPDQYFRASKPTELADLIGRSANRVIRNFHQSGLLHLEQSDQPDACMHYVRSYHKAKGCKCSTGW